ncbi:MAG TPA: DPP IV N-terminal domain-containing protein, partial [Gemmatimonadales bacterium]|nr:DPP IV N-terminal domain-containing protein [Gemmatimonadales bacterium]
MPTVRLRFLSFPLALALTRLVPAGAQEPRGTPSFAEPGIAPDRSEIAFVSGGDIWTVPAAGGVAHLLVSHTATESRPLFSPDGTRLAFGSTRTGNGDIYVLTLATGELRRLTFDDSAEQPDAWSPDGRWIWFSSNRGDIAGMNDLWRVSAEGGTPMPVAADRYASEYWAAPAPTGAAVAMTARGVVSTQWWRRGHSHLDESEIWILRDPDAMRYERVSTGGSKDAWPMWLPDGRTLYHVTDRNGVQNLVRRTGPGDAVQVTRFTTGRVLWPTISRDGSAIAFERDFRIWTLETGTGEAREVPVTLRGAPAGPTVERMTYTNQLQDLALSPDGRKVAFVVRGEVFAAAAREGGDATRVTETAARERQVRWAPDSRRLVYLSDRDGIQSLYLYDFGSRTESRLTNTPAGDVSPVFSPDGKSIAFKRGGRELWVIDLESKRERRLATAQRERVPFISDGRIAWSPDGRWIAYVEVAGKLFSNVYVVPADGGGPGRQVTFLANVFGGQISWSPDGTYLLYDSSQRTEERQLARVDLVPRTPRFREDQFHDLFRQQTPRPSPADRAPPADSAPRDTAR